jgi:SAM-dependent methyltransferase
MTLQSKISTLFHHPIIIKDVFQAKSPEEIRTKLKTLRERQIKLQNEKEINNYISHLKRNSPFSIDKNNNLMLNRLCYLEDWDNKELRKIINELQNPIYETYIHRNDWTTTSTNNKIVGMRKPGLIHRKDWEWALGIIAMKRFNKLNDKCTAIGIGAGREEVLFYLANNLKHVYATDIYDGKEWDNFAPSDFPENPKKYAPFPYREDALTVLRMDGTKLEFPSETFDIAFSFSSIEHFGGQNHEGALKSLKEIERILKKEGIAVITTEYIINNKIHPEFFNRDTIYSDLIDKLDSLKLAEPLDLRITTKTLDTVLDYPNAVYWDTSDDDEFKKNHPLTLIKVGNILVTSVMLVFKKH